MITEARFATMNYSPTPATAFENETFRTSAPMDPMIAQHLASSLDSIQAFIQDFTELILQSPFSKDSLHRLSIVLLVFERLQRPYLHAAASAGTTTKSTGSNEQNFSKSLSHHEEVGDQLGLLLLTVLAFFITRTGSSRNGGNTSSHSSLTEEFVIVMTILFSIICLESFLPLAFWCFTSLLLFRNVCWETTLSVLVVIWIAGTIGSAVSWDTYVGF